MQMKNAKGLGRGLDALLGVSRGDAHSNELQSVDVHRLIPGKYQPRTRMDQQSLLTLAESIKTQGLMQPILVREVSANKLEIIAGERRWRAAQIAGLTELPVLIKKVADEAALAMALIENIQRENLNPLEEANGIQRLINEFGMTHQIAADAVGRSRSAVTNLLRLLQLPSEVQSTMMDGLIDMGHARALLSLPPSLQTSGANHVVSKKWSVRETEKWVATVTAPEKKSKILQQPNQDVVNLIEKLSDQLGTKVHIQAKQNGAGKLVIDYTDLNQLDSIIRRL